MIIFKKNHQILRRLLECCCFSPFPKLRSFKTDMLIEPKVSKSRFLQDFVQKLYFMRKLKQSLSRGVFFT